ncbi:hypothetical protein BDV28DRAFT_128141, partial [Aspergillus coremiiformis]
MGDFPSTHNHNITVAFKKKPKPSRQTKPPIFPPTAEIKKRATQSNPPISPQSFYSLRQIGLVFSLIAIPTCQAPAKGPLVNGLVILTAVDDKPGPGAGPL